MEDLKLLVSASRSLLESRGYTVTPRESVKMKHIVDTWNMIEKYGIDDWEDHEDYILISEESYQKILDGAKNKRYIQNLRLSRSTESNKKNPFVHRNEKEKCYDCGRDGWSYDEKDDDDDEGDKEIEEAESTNSYNLSVTIPENVMYHIKNGNLSEKDLVSEMHDWDGLTDTAIFINKGIVSVKGLNKEWYTELKNNLQRWLKQYGGDLDLKYSE